MPIPTAVGLDVGGTKIAGGLVTAAGEVLHRLSPIPTPDDQSEIVRTLCRAVEQLRREYPQVAAVGVGAAGLVDWPSGQIRWGANNAFLRLPLRDLLAEASGLPTVVDNDANTAAWGEARHAALSDLAFLTVGTGVGGGLIVRDRLYRGQTGIAAEIGHLVVDPEGGQRCGCGNVGCLEAMASGTALGRYGRAAAMAEPDGPIATLAGGPERVTGHTVHEAALAGDPIARQLIGRVGRWLGVGIANLVNMFDFDLVVVGGGLSSVGDLLLDPAREAFEEYVFAPAHRSPTSIISAQLGPDAGWIGAARLALDDLEAGATPDPPSSLGVGEESLRRPVPPVVSTT